MWISPPSSIIYLEQIYWERMVGEEEGRGFTPMKRGDPPLPPCKGVILSEPVWQYRCMNLPKMIEHIKMIPTPYLDILSMLLSGRSAL